ncbi:MAG: hypothetical protein ACK4WF_06765 [Candidatus Brocadiales bacterium]
MYREAVGLIARYLISDSVLFLLVRGRVYPGEIAEIKDPQYPCVTYKVVGGGTDREVKEVKGMTLNFWVYSKVSLEECYKIYDTLSDRLFDAFLQGTSGTKVLRPREVMAPVSYTDVGGTIYRVAGRWSVELIKQ